MPIKAWVHWLDWNQRQNNQEILTHLKAQGIDADCADGLLCNGHGITFSTEVNPQVCEKLQELSRNGKLQVLACCCSKVSGEAVWQLIAAGASDVLVCSECSAAAINGIGSRLQRWDTVSQLLLLPVVKENLISDSYTFNAILRQLVEVAHFTDSSVLILGESGTGKELLANLVHDLDQRPDKGELVILDCSTIMPELSGSEFFGHERGAFTGAVSSRDGAFAMADGGTLFLDEIGELPLNLQAQLLRAIQEGTYKRVGGNQWHKTSFRLVAATNQDLWALVQSNNFRADLYYRIASFVCRVPPLRERPEDILPLARHFIKQNTLVGSSPPLDEFVEDYLLRREYPGNVRDLRQVLNRMLCRYAGEGAITVGCIPPEDRPSGLEIGTSWRDDGFERAIRTALERGVGLKTISKETEKTAIQIAVDETGGNLQQAAQALGVTDRTLQMWRAAQRQTSE